MSTKVGYGAANVDPRGPVFISYRQSDGTELAVETAWSLRAAGVPVWHDRSDLPPGETNRRLAEALNSGLSGAVLLVTPEIEHSKVIREIELPRLLTLANNEAFTFSVLSAVEVKPANWITPRPTASSGSVPAPWAHSDKILLVLRRCGRRQVMPSPAGDWKR